MGFMLDNLYVPVRDNPHEPLPLTEQDYEPLAPMFHIQTRLDSIFPSERDAAARAAGFGPARAPQP